MYNYCLLLENYLKLEGNSDPLSSSSTNTGLQFFVAKSHHCRRRLSVSALCCAQEMPASCRWNLVCTAINRHDTINELAIANISFPEVFFEVVNLYYHLCQFDVTEFGQKPWSEHVRTKGYSLSWVKTRAVFMWNLKAVFSGCAALTGCLAPNPANDYPEGRAFLALNVWKWTKKRIWDLRWFKVHSIKEVSGLHISNFHFPVRSACFLVHRSWWSGSSAIVLPLTVSVPGISQDSNIFKLDYALIGYAIPFVLRLPSFALSTSEYRRAVFNLFALHRASA